MPKKHAKYSRKGRKIGGWNPFSADSWKSLGNKDTWKDLGNKIVDTGKKIAQPVTNLVGAASDTLKGMKDKENWRNAIVNPKDFYNTSTKPWLEKNKVISSALNTFGGIQAKPLSYLAEKSGLGIRKKRTVKRKSVKKRGGKLFL